MRLIISGSKNTLGSIIYLDAPNNFQGKSSGKNEKRVVNGEEICSWDGEK